MKTTSRRRKKRSLTLLEVTIAVFLTGILLSSLWQIYHNWYKSYQKVQVLQTKTHKVIFIKQKLDELFFLASISEEEGFFFTPKDLVNTYPSLCISYKGRPDPEIAFNGVLRSLLYVDNLKQLCLATWSSDLQNRIEILGRNISFFEMNFFDHQTNSWQADWPETLDHNPLWIRLQITNTDGTNNLIFRGLHPDGPILYLETFEGPGGSR